MGFAQEGSSMSECPLCGQATSKASARLIRDECGHFKCRMCLLQEENGCTICHNNTNHDNNSKIHSIGNFDYPVPESNMPSLDDAECTTDGNEGLVVNKLNHNNPYDSLFDVGLNEEVQSTQNLRSIDGNGLDDDGTNGIDDLLNASCQFMEKEPVINEMESLQIGQVTSTINYNANQKQSDKSATYNANENISAISEKSNGHALQTPLQQITNQLQTNPLIQQQIINKLPKPTGAAPACRIILLRIVTNQNKTVPPTLLPIQSQTSSSNNKNAAAIQNSNNVVVTQEQVNSRSLESTGGKNSEYDLSDFLLFKKQPEKKNKNLNKITHSLPDVTITDTGNQISKINNKVKIKSDVIVNHSDKVLKKGQKMVKCQNATSTENKSLDMPSIDCIYDDSAKEDNTDNIDTNINTSKNSITANTITEISECISTNVDEVKDTKTFTNTENSLKHESTLNLLNLAAVAENSKPIEVLNNVQINSKNDKIEEDESKPIALKLNSSKMKIGINSVTPETKLQSEKQVKENVRRGERQRKPKRLLYEDDDLKIRYKKVSKEEKPHQYKKKNYCIGKDKALVNERIINENIEGTIIHNNKVKDIEIKEEPVIKKESNENVHRQNDHNVIQPKKRGRPKKTDSKNEKYAGNLPKKSPGRPRRDWSHIIEQSDGTYKCNGCQRIFGRYNSKVYHGVCSEVEPAPKFNYKCEECNRYFATKQHYLYHHRGHTGDRPYKCKECKKGFRTRGKLNRHLMCHKSRGDVECNDCGKLFNSKDNLKVHLTVHSRVRYHCRFCPSSYSFEHNRKRHEERHTSIDWFKCEICGKSFRTKFLMRRHLRVHGPAKLFNCEHCSRLFLTRFALQRHVITHFAEKMFSCKICGEGFNRSDNLARHVEFHHKNEEQLITSPLESSNIEEQIVATTIVKRVSSVDDVALVTKVTTIENVSSDSKETCKIDEIKDEIKFENEILDVVKERKNDEVIEKQIMVIVEKVKELPSTALPTKRPRGRPKKIKRVLKKKNDDGPIKIKRLVDSDNLIASIPASEIAEINQSIEKHSTTGFPGLSSNDSISTLSTDISEKENNKITPVLKEKFENEPSDSQADSFIQEVELDQGVTTKCSETSLNGVPQHWRRRTAESLKPKLLNIE